MGPWVWDGAVGGFPGRSQPGGAMEKARPRPADRVGLMALLPPGLTIPEEARLVTQGFLGPGHGPSSCGNPPGGHISPARDLGRLFPPPCAHP